MTFKEAKELLSTLRRDLCVDYAFGDAEVSWHDDEINPELHGNTVASGYFSSVRGTGEITVYAIGEYEANGSPKVLGQFDGAEAKSLRGCFKTSRVTRNDDPRSGA